MNSRERVLARVRRALGEGSAGTYGPSAGSTARVSDAQVSDVQVAAAQLSAAYEQDVPRAYREEHGSRTPAEAAELLAANLAEYRALVHRAREAELPALIARLLADRSAASVLVPPGLPEAWLAATGTPRVPDGADSGPHELDAVSAVVTGCALAIAETGTIVLDGSPDQGRRRISLIPDHHICVVRVPDQVVASVPQALARLDPRRPLTWISGPSATSDIELDRVEGVHGPRTLQVLLVE